MKFAKYLQDEVVPEWRKAYINYKQGKKYLRAIEIALDLKEEAEEAVVASALAEGAVLEDGGIIISTDYPTTGSDSTAPLRVRYDTQASLGAATATSSTSSPSQTPDPPDEGQEETTTPIISKRRGHGRNYSAIIIPPVSSLGVPSGQERSGDGQESMVLEEDRSGLGGSTLHESNTDAGIPLKRGSISSPLRTDTSKSAATTGFQFSLTARTQSSQILKSISRRFTIIHPDNFPVRSRPIQVEDGSIEAVLPQLLPEERVFFHFLDSQLEMVNNFYREKELEAVTKLKVIRQQLYVANEWKRRYDDKLAKQEAERGWYAAEWSRVTKGFGNLMRADTTATEDVVFTPSRITRQNPGSSVPSATPVYSFENTPSDSERCLRRRDLRGLGRGVLPLHDLQRKQVMDSLAYREELILEEEENRRQHLNHKVARTRIKAALYEFYRSLEMIKNYKVLNHTGFAKILKKFDKTAGWRASKPYMNSKLKPAYFMTSGIIQDLIVETEDLFIDTFEKGHRRRGMAKLRIPDSKNQTHHLTSTRIGIYMGLTAPLMVQALQAAFSTKREEEVPYWDSLLLVYAGLFLSILFACLFGINMYVWAKSRINYKFIFEFDPRDNLDFHEYFELPIFLMLLLTLAVYLDFGSKLTAHVATAYWPLILISITFSILFCPLPIAHFTARRWFISSIGRILASGFYRVEFRDFFLADEMNSLSYSIEQFEFAMCAYSQQWNNLGQTCSTSHMWVTPFFTALPAWFRFLQCLRRYRDTLEWFPHLLNAGKYMTSLVNLFVYFSYRHYGGTTLRIYFILVSTVTSIYTFAWDIYMDWGLFRLGKQAPVYPLLRQELVYSRVWVYYLAIVLDLLGRFSWVVRLIPMNINVNLLSFVLAFLEVLRRWQWNFFRLENEHLNNCGQFRAIKDIPLPFHIRVEGETDDDDDDEEDEECETEDRYYHHQDQSAGVFIGDELRDLQDVYEENEYRQDHERAEGDAAVIAPGHPFAGKVRSSSSHSGFAKLSNGLLSHGLSNFSNKGGTGIGGEASIGYSNNSTSRISLHSNNSHISSKKGPRRPTSLASATSGLGGLGSRRTFSHDHIVGSTQDPVHPFGVARSNSFVENAVAEAGFKDSQREALTTEASSNNKFYDRRDFDSKIIDADSDLWSSRGSPSVSHGLPSMGFGGGSGVDAGRGVLAQIPDGTSGANGGRAVGAVVSRRKASIGTRMRASIFGRKKNSDDDDEYHDEDTE
ncbi:xenotropic and polytropic retrovirus receptor 1 [Entomortierella parvispora]|uniref:Xenotropic and polytropic retrovirus receptor 1 n=1 Tax=Entomortierella parvispora TaxID=205924 RepID=A0A9P3LVX7_9FUNG|nr:xenotropic and polytropic retrovirus receptor 1 [Entomortierella parvispora]